VRTVARDYEEYVHHWAAAKRNAQDWELDEAWKKSEKGTLQAGNSERGYFRHHIDLNLEWEFCNVREYNNLELERP